MFSERVSKVFSSRAFYIIFSLITAFALWLFVSYDANQSITVPVSGIQINYEGDTTLGDKSLIITDINVETLTLRFSGRQTAVSKLKTKPPTATVDLSAISSAGIYQLPFTLSYPSGIDTSSISLVGGSVDYVTISVEKLVEKDIPVAGIYNGGTQEGYTAEPVEFDPAFVTVSGPDDIVSTVSKAWVNIQRENLAKTVEEQMAFVLVDENGDEIDSDYLSVSRDKITVRIPILMKKDIALTVNTVYGAGATGNNTIITVEPSIVTVTGDSEVLSDLNQISIGTIDVTKLALAGSYTFPIVIPNDTSNVTGVTEAKVEVKVVGVTTMRISATNIQCSNPTAGYDAEIITQSLDVTVRGIEEKLELVTNENIRIVADLSDLGDTTGSFSVPAKVSIDGVSDVGAVGDYKVSVTIVKAEE
ncbi:MAG: hypothetical protein HUJ65_00040 [Oscillospiraceae bacterium]|nr:hypothetical protein [Oscillospiraceae bacterium]